jgi:hypothetical protein
VVSEEKFLCEFPIRSYVKLSSAVGAILIEGPNRLTHIWKRTIQWLFHQNWGMKLKKNLLLWNYWANLNQTLLKWFLGGPLPKLCPAFRNTDQDGRHSRKAVGAILIEGPNRRTHIWKRTIQWLFHQNFVFIEQMDSDKKIFMGISHRVLC